MSHATQSKIPESSHSCYEAFESLQVIINQFTEWKGFTLVREKIVSAETHADNVKQSFIEIV